MLAAMRHTALGALSIWGVVMILVFGTHKWIVPIHLVILHASSSRGHENFGRGVGYIGRRCVGLQNHGLFVTI